VPIPDTREDLKNAGKALKQHGHRAGVAISHCLDVNSTFRYVPWCYGGKVLEEGGKTVAIKSDKSDVTKQVLEFNRDLYI
jgi:hypothetical protein